MDSPLEAYLLVLNTYGTDEVVYDFRETAKGIYLITVILLDEDISKRL